MLVLKNARLIPELTEGYGERFGDVVVDGGIIADIRPANSVAPRRRKSSTCAERL